MFTRIRIIGFVCIYICKYVLHRSHYIINLCINLYNLLRHFHQNSRLLRYIWRLILRTDHCYKQTSLQDKMEEMCLNEKKNPSFINLFKTYSYSCGRKNMFILRFVFDILTLKVLQKHDMFHHIGVENSPTLSSFHQRKPLFSINKLRTLLIIQLLYSFFIPKNLFSLRLLQKKTLVAKPFTCI